MSQPLHILIVDDEAPARRKLRRLLQDDPRVASLDEAPDGLAAVSALRRGGRVVLCGVTTGAKAEIDLQRVYWNQLSVLGAAVSAAAVSDRSAVIPV